MTKQGTDQRFRRDIDESRQPCSYYIENTEHNCPYYNSKRYIPINKLNNISVEYKLELDNLLWRKKPIFL